METDGFSRALFSTVLGRMHAARESLIFLPGAGGDRDLWRPLAARLQHPGERRFVGWPGFGGVPSDPSVHGLSTLCERLVLELSGPSALFAQSMGGVVALLTALAKPELLTRLVLSVTSGGLDVVGLGGVDWRPEFRRLNPGVPHWFERERWDLVERLPEVQAPVLLLWGDADPISPVAVGRRLQELLPRAELFVVRGGTHDLVSSRVDEILPRVQAHLDAVLTPIDAPPGV